MTGEVTLRGRVLPIGGLKEKTMAACRSGIKTVFLPADNVPDLEDIDPDVRAALRFVLVDRVDTVLAQALEPRRDPGALEALAIVAYFQPVTRAYVEQVRGVDSSYTVASLADKGLITPAGRLEAPGRPTLYKTTDAFLRVMGLSSLEELPALPDMSATDGMDKLREAIDELKGRGEQLELEMDAGGGDA